MNLVRWEPFREMERLLDVDFPMVIPRANWDLAVDVYEDKGTVVAEMNVPGVDKDKLDISIENNILHITGQREEIKESKNKNFYSKEISRGSFERRVRLPGEVDGKKAEAEFKDGVLKITAPKKQATLVDKIKIQPK